MREFKFRVWKHVNTPEMFNDVQVIDFKSGIAHLGYSLSSFKERTDKERLENLILMQYTGLKDKNGVEIYEGDIVEWLDRNFDAAFGNSDGPDWFNRTKLIKFIDQGFNVPQGIIRELKVIGNIYENPELLGDSQ